jgi:Tfp pilus assembly ATPase PilU
MQAGKKFGMQTLTDALYTLYMQREIPLEEALRVAPDQNELLRAIGEPLQGDERTSAGKLR